MTRFLLITRGTGGDLFPFIHIGCLLKERGHDVILFTHGFYAQLVTQAGLGFVALDDQETFQQMASDQKLLSAPQEMLVFYRRYVMPTMLAECKSLETFSHADDTILVAHPNSHLSAQLVAEKLGLPLISILLFPIYLKVGIRMEEALRHHLLPEISQIRKDLGLPVIEQPENWFRSVTKCLALWPNWFSAIEATWPFAIEQVGFLLDTIVSNKPLPDSVHEFLDAGARPILITHATSLVTDQSYFEASIKACKTLGRRGILVTRNKPAVAASAGSDFCWFEALPLATLLPHVDAMIHHGGIGTLAHALAAGTPQLVLASGFDRPDNANHLKHLGVAAYLPQIEWDAEYVAVALERLLCDPKTQKNCQTVSRRMSDSSTEITVVEAIEEVASNAKRSNRVAKPILPDVDLTQQCKQPSKGRKLRFLFVNNAVYIPAHGGANKACRMLLEGLASQGHTCRAVVPASGAQDHMTQTQFLSFLSQNDILAVADKDIVRFSLHNVDVHAVIGATKFRSQVVQQIQDFSPDWVLVSSEDPGQVLLGAALEAIPDRVVYLAHTTLHLPFGPHAFSPSPLNASLLHQVAGVIATSKNLQDYLRRWGEIESEVLYYPVYGSKPFPILGQFDRGFVTLINPCAYKGISIFIALARAFPQIAFAAVPSWGTTQADKKALQELPNVQLLEPSDRIDDIYSKTRVLLVPSLWHEALGMVAVEAMLRAIPVLASNSGGLPEAMAGTDYVIPVRLIEQLESTLDDVLKPDAIVPQQEIAPWADALQKLLSEREHYQQLSNQARNTALEFVSNARIELFEAYFRKLMPTQTKNQQTHLTSQTKMDTPVTLSNLENSLSPERLALLARMLAEQKKGGKQPTALVIPKLPRGKEKAHFPLSFAQERLWFLHQFDPTNPAYNTAHVFRMTGTLDKTALEYGFCEIVKRHEILRTTFELIDDTPVQIITSNASLTVPTVDLSHLSAIEKERAAKQYSQDEARRPFELAQGPLLRVTLLQLSDTEYHLLLTLHHIVADGWSATVLVQELTHLYNAFLEKKTPELRSLNIQYADFSSWQRQQLHNSALQDDFGYWKNQLTGAPQLSVPTPDRPRPAVQTFNGASYTFCLSAELSKQLYELSRREEVSLFMIFLAALNCLLYRYTGQEDIVVGSVIANRRQVELEALIGFFVNTLAFRTDLSDSPSLLELLKRTRSIALDAYAHQNLPFEKLVEELHPQRNLSFSPIFQVMLVLNNTQRTELSLPGLAVEYLPIETGLTKFDLSLSIDETPNILRGTLTYNTDLFDADTIERMLEHYQLILNAFINNSSQSIARLPLLTPAEQQQILAWNDTRTVYPIESCVHELFERQVALTPDSVAVIYPGCKQALSQLTYQELNQRANQLAHYLQKRGVDSDQLVGICMERSPQLIVGLLAILKAGAAYLPLDPSYPNERIKFMLDDSQAKVLLTQHSLRDKFSETVDVICLDDDWNMIQCESWISPASDTGPENLAYVIYTSGSTGKPKGVTVPHKAINRLVKNTDYVQLTPNDRIAQASNASFDAATFEIWGALLNGAQLIGIHQDILLSPSSCADYLRAQGINVMFLTTALFNQFVAQVPGIFACLRDLLFGGEKVEPKWVRELLRCDPPQRLLHVYGPTENTTFTSWYLVQNVGENDFTVPIGKPIANTQIYLLDKNLMPVPVGVPGEIYVGGDGLARDYLNRAELTSERFVSGSLEQIVTYPTRLYKTGDLARYLPDGNIEFLERVDNQVKIRGFRIELGEIEIELSKHPTVSENLVLAREDIPGEKRLVAYVVLRTKENLTLVDIRNFLREQLPEYMLPTALIVMDSFPLTVNGKVDRQVLPIPSTERIDAHGAIVGSRDAIELQLVRIWEDVLNVRPIGVSDNFFDLGGHSLLSVRLMAQIKKVFGRDLPLSTLFEGPTIESLATILRQQSDVLQWSSLVPVQPNGSKPPLYCIHPVGGNILCYVDLARDLGAEQPLYGLQSLGLHERDEPLLTIEEIASHYVDVIRQFQPQGPYRVSGYCFGGIVAYEIAQQLKRDGDDISCLALLDTYAPLPLNEQHDIDRATVVSWFVRDLAGGMGKRFSIPPEELREFAPEEQLYHALKKLQMANLMPPDANIDQLNRYLKVYLANAQAMGNYQPKPYDDSVILLRAMERDAQVEPTLGWGKYVKEELFIHNVPGDHYTMMLEPQVSSLADQLRALLDFSEMRVSSEAQLSDEGKEDTHTDFSIVHGVCHEQ